MRGQLGSAALLLVGCLMAGAIGECSARSFGLSKTWNSYRSAPDYMSLSMSTGELIGFRRLPSQAWPAPFGTETRTNSAGFRGSEFPDSEKASALRLMWLGDSVTEGYGVGETERFSERVRERLASRTSTPVESVNLGVAGHSTVDQVAVWERWGAQLAPDVLIVQLGDNDVGGNLMKAEAFASGAWDQPNPGLVTASPTCVLLWSRDETVWCSPKQVLQQHSALYLAVAERYQALRIRSGAGADKSVFLAPVEPRGWEVMQGALKRLLESVAPHTQVILLYVPVEPRVHAPEGSAPGGLGERLMADAELGDRAIVVDATSDLRGGRGLFLDEVHLTREGHNRMAELIDQLVAIPVRPDSPAENPNADAQNRE